MGDYYYNSGFQSNLYGNPLRHSFNAYGQSKIKMQMQDTLKMEEQTYSNDILCRMLSAAECYYNRLLGLNNQKELFGYYNGFNSGNTKDIQKLKKQLLHEIEIFKASYEDYYHNYEKYDFPRNLTRDFVLTKLRKWKKDIESNPKIKNEGKYFGSIIDLLDKGNTNFDYRNEIKQMNRGKVNKEGDVAYQLMYNIPYIQEKAERMGQQVRENASKGIFDVDVVLNGNYKDDDLYERQKNYSKLRGNNNDNFQNFNYSKNDKNNDDEKMEVEYFDNQNNLCEESENKIIEIFKKMKSCFESYNSYLSNTFYPTTNTLYNQKSELKNQLKDQIDKFDNNYNKHLRKFNKPIKEISKQLNALSKKASKIYETTKDSLIYKLKYTIEKYEKC